MIWCLHGAVGMAEDWKGLAGSLGREGEVVRRVDLWRYLDCEPMELAAFGKAFCGEVRAAGAEQKHVLAGYSMGGRLALHALLEEPELFAGAVIVSAHPGLPDERERILRMAADAAWAGKALVGDWRMFLREWEGQAVLDPDGVEPQGLGDRRLLEQRRQAVARSFMDWSLGKQEDLRGRLGECDLPVLWVTGGRDGKFTALAEEVAPLMRRGRHVVVAGAGHRVPWEDGGAFHGLVRGFLDGL